jgi:hypothetical protein
MNGFSLILACATPSSSSARARKRRNVIRLQQRPYIAFVKPTYTHGAAVAQTFENTHFLSITSMCALCICLPALRVSESPACDSAYVRRAWTLSAEWQHVYTQYLDHYLCLNMSMMSAAHRF